MAARVPSEITGSNGLDAVALGPGTVCVVWQGGAANEDDLVESVLRKDVVTAARVFASDVVGVPLLCVSGETLHLLVGPSKYGERYTSLPHFTRPVAGGDWTVREPIKLGPKEGWAGLDAVAVPGGIAIAAVVKQDQDTKEYHDAFELRVERRADDGRLISQQVLDRFEDLKVRQPAPVILVSGDTTTVFWARSSRSDDGWGHAILLRYRWQGVATAVQPDTLMVLPKTTANEVVVVDRASSQRFVVSTGGGLFFSTEDPSSRNGISLALPAQALNLAFADTNGLVALGPVLAWLDTRKRTESWFERLLELGQSVTFMNADVQVLKKESVWSGQPGKLIPRTIGAPGIGIHSIALADDGAATYIVCLWFRGPFAPESNPVSPAPYVTVVPH